MFSDTQYTTVPKDTNSVFTTFNSNISGKT